MQATKDEAQQSSAAPAKAQPALSKQASLEARQARWAQAFSSIVAVMMKDDTYKAVRLAELEHMVIPAVVSGQWRVGHAPVRSARDEKSEASQPGSPIMTPAAAVLWAQVSDEIDRRMSSSDDKGILLAPHQWISGRHTWIVLAAGDNNALARVIQQLRQTDLAGKVVKMRARGPDGKDVIRTLGEASRESERVKAFKFHS